MSVERRRAGLAQGANQSRRQAGREIRIPRRPGRQPLPGADVCHEAWLAAQALKSINDGHGEDYSRSPSLRGDDRMAGNYRTAEATDG